MVIYWHGFITGEKGREAWLKSPEENTGDVLVFNIESTVSALGQNSVFVVD